jgi:glycine oxidase
MRSEELSGAGGGSAERTADAIIVGGGVIGLAIARSLARRGVRRVILLERGAVGAESSHAAGGMLAVQAEADCEDAFLELACASRDIYPAFAAELLAETGIDIQLDRTGTLYLGFTEEDSEEMERRYRWQAGAGLLVQKLTIEEARELEPCVSERVRAALLFPLDAQVENRRLVAALAASTERLGVCLLTNTQARSLCLERGRVCGVETSGGLFDAPLVVIACGAWSSLLVATSGGGSAVTPPRIEPVRGQMLCFEAGPSFARHVIYSPRGYLVPRLDGRLLAGSTTEHAGYEKRVTGAGLHAMMTHALEIAPGVGELALVDCWSGLRPRAEDDLPVLGASAEIHGLFYATGHYRNGILLAPITGELMADAILHKETPRLLKAFTPDRFQYAGAG